ncbi:MAG TPA: 2-oxoglutarate and iron-dependent oxygenase domain-containing protein [Burkholderiales bacterium]|nr:2-oxoglutarate and iron-dependent oxygenase domain-containing protein [Burkholderiales bacterium]
MIVYTPPRAAASIPVVDLGGSFSPSREARKQVAWDIHKACRDTGFFYVAGHRVPRELVAAQFECAKRVFALPLEEKMRLHMRNSASTSGYEPVGGQVLDSQDAEKAPPDLKESFYFAMELPEDHPWAQKRIRSFGHNQWPALEGFRSQTLAYQAAMRELGDRVLAMLALSLELDEGFFAPYYDMPGTTLRLLRYPPHPRAAQANQLGAGAHTDWGGITLLAQDALGGLEVRNAAGEWIQATPIPDTFVVNLGDLMQRWTNDVYRSNMHRVKNNSSSHDRYSIPFFYSPRPDSRIACMPTCASAENPPRYAPCTAAEHTYEMFKRSYGYSPIGGST